MQFFITLINFYDHITTLVVGIMTRSTLGKKDRYLFKWEDRPVIERYCMGVLHRYYTGIA